MKKSNSQHSEEGEEDQENKCTLIDLDLEDYEEEWYPLEVDFVQEAI